MATKSSDKAVAKKTQVHREKILALIHERGEVSTTEVCQVLGLQEARVRQILSGMVADSLIEAEGVNKSRWYRAKKE